MAQTPTDRNLIPLYKGDLQIAMGAIPGWSSFRKFGSNPDVDAGTEDIWSEGGIRQLPSTYGPATVVSSNAQDNLASGTGIGSVMVVGLDENWNEQEVEVTLTGITPVVTTETWARVHRMYGTMAGGGVADQEKTGTVSAGNITCTVDSSVQCAIATGNGQSLLAAYSVPANKTLIIDNINFATGRTAASDTRMSLQYKKFEEDVWRVQVRQDVYQIAASLLNIDIVFPQKSDIRCQATVTGNNLRCSASFDGYLVDNNIGI